MRKIRFQKLGVSGVVAAAAVALWVSPASGADNPQAPEAHKAPEQVSVSAGSPKAGLEAQADGKGNASANVFAGGKVRASVSAERIRRRDDVDFGGSVDIKPTGTSVQQAKLAAVKAAKVKAAKARAAVRPETVQTASAGFSGWGSWTAQWQTAPRPAAASGAGASLKLAALVGLWGLGLLGAGGGVYGGYRIFTRGGGPKLRPASA